MPDAGTAAKAGRSACGRPTVGVRRAPLLFRALGLQPPVHLGEHRINLGDVQVPEVGDLVSVLEQLGHGPPRLPEYLVDLQWIAARPRPASAWHGTELPA